MQYKTGLAALLAAVSLGVSAAPATMGFSALTPTTITAGGSVDFVVTFDKYQDLQGIGIAEPEPAPALGVQTWLISQTTDFSETLDSLHLEASSSAAPGGVLTFDESPAAPPGSLYNTQWLFSMSFAVLGDYTVTAGGNWASLMSIGDLTLQGNRECRNDGLGVLVCDPWAMSGVGGSALQDTSGVLDRQTISVHVEAAPVPVPEPQTLVTVALGLLALVATRRRRR